LAYLAGCRFHHETRPVPNPKRPTLAIIFGLLPTALGVGIGGAQRSAIAVTIIGAQSLCLFLTLLLVPAAYVKLDALEQSLANRGLSAWLSKVRALGLGRRPGTEGVSN